MSGRAVVFDLEAIPDGVMGQRVYGTSDPEAMLTARRAETKDRTDFLKAALWRVVAMGRVLIDFDTLLIKVEAQCHAGEADLVRLLDGSLKGRPLLVGWNSGGYDLPVLRYRALYYGIPLPRYYGDPDGKPWESYHNRYAGLHCDLADHLSGFGACERLTLREAAALCDVPVKQHADGGQVLSLWQRGEYETIRCYVLEDAIATARIFLRYRLSQGRLDREAYDTLDYSCTREFGIALVGPAPGSAAA